MLHIDHFTVSDYKVSLPDYKLIDSGMDSNVYDYDESSVLVTGQMAKSGIKILVYIRLGLLIDSCFADSTIGRVYVLRVKKLVFWGKMTSDQRALVSKFHDLAYSIEKHGGTWRLGEGKEYFSRLSNAEFSQSIKAFFSWCSDWSNAEPRLIPDCHLGNWAINPLTNEVLPVDCLYLKINWH